MKRTPFNRTSSSSVLKQSKPLKRTGFGTRKTKKRTVADGPPIGATKREGVSELKKNADKWYSLYIRYRDAHFVRGEWMCLCITCPSERPVREMQNGHFVSRRILKLRYDDRNCNVQCPKCNVFNHGELYLYGISLDKKWGDGTAASLMAERFTTGVKFRADDYRRIIDESKLKILQILGELPR